jgi:hypothetical protein
MDLVFFEERTWWCWGEMVKEEHVHLNGTI